MVAGGCNRGIGADGAANGAISNEAADLRGMGGSLKGVVMVTMPSGQFGPGLGRVQIKGISVMETPSGGAIFGARCTKISGGKVATIFRPVGKRLWASAATTVTFQFFDLPPATMRTQHEPQEGFGQTAAMGSSQRTTFRKCVQGTRSFGPSTSTRLPYRATSRRRASHGPYCAQLLPFVVRSWPFISQLPTLSAPGVRRLARARRSCSRYER